jgi:hypothetical protein
VVARVRRLGRLGPLLPALACALTLAASAAGAREPTFKEREALTQALPAPFRSYPVGCVWLEMSVSTSGTYAVVSPGFLSAQHLPCLRYASNGYWLLRKLGTWKIVFNGSEQPPCALHVPRDLRPACS